MKFLVAFFVLVLALSCRQPEPEATTPTAQEMMEATFHLNRVFDQDMNARVPTDELILPEAARARFDADGDGFVSFGEYETMARQSASGPTEPRDRSEFTHLTDGGYPLNLDPEIVSPEEVQLGDEDLVMGVVISGEPRAYPVNYMNGPYNEVVNDELGGQAIAPSW